MASYKISSLHRLDFYKKKADWKLATATITFEPKNETFCYKAGDTESERPTSSNDEYLNGSHEACESVAITEQSELSTSKNNVSCRIRKLLQAQKLLEPEEQDKQTHDDDPDDALAHHNSEESSDEITFDVSNEFWASLSVSGDEVTLTQFYISDAEVSNDKIAHTDHMPAQNNFLANISLLSAQIFLDEGEDANNWQDEDSYCEFIRGAHEAAHSSETDICVPAAWENEISSKNLAHISSRQLAGRMATHAHALKRLMREAEIRKEQNFTHLSAILARPSRQSISHVFDFNSDYQFRGIGDAEYSAAMDHSRLPPLRPPKEIIKSSGGYFLNNV